MINLVDKPKSDRRLRQWLSIICILVLCSCEDDPFPEPVERVIPKLVRPYVDQFVLEAEKRGVALDTSKLSFGFDRDLTVSLAGDQKTVVGSCSRSENLHLVNIDTLNALWLLSGYLGKEEIVFHELGHCLLNRAHRDDKLVSGDFASIMRTVGLLQYGDLNNFTGIFLQPTGIKAHRRDYYIDELFNQTGATPCWSDTEMSSPYPVTLFNQDFIENREFRHSWIDPEGDFWLYGGLLNYRYRDGGFESPMSDVKITAMNNYQGQLWIGGSSIQKNIIGTYSDSQLDIKYDITDLLGDQAKIDWLVFDDTGRLWFSDNAGDLYVSSQNGFDKVEFTTPEWISRLYKGPNNNVYLLKGGRFYMVDDAKNFVQVSMANAEVPVEFFRDLVVDGSGTAWLRPGASLPFLLQFEDDFSVRQLHYSSINLIEVRVNDLACDPNGTIWAATSNGLRKWDGASFSGYCEYNTGLRILDFNNITVGENGNIWSIGKDTTSLLQTLVLSQPGG